MCSYSLERGVFFQTRYATAILPRLVLYCNCRANFYDIENITRTHTRTIIATKGEAVAYTHEPSCLWLCLVSEKQTNHVHLDSAGYLKTLTSYSSTRGLLGLAARHHQRLIVRKCSTAFQGQSICASLGCAPRSWTGLPHNFLCLERTALCVPSLTAMFRRLLVQQPHPPSQHVTLPTVLGKQHKEL